MTLKVGIIGGGSASMVCAATICGVSHKLEIELTLITDPNILPIRVGESMSPMLLTLMDQNLRLFNLDNSCKIFEDLDMMPRIGARHTWEDNVNPSFDINYHSFAAHFDSSKFTKFVRNRLKELYPGYTEINDSIKGITQNELSAIAHGATENYRFDFIFDCRGFPTESEFDNEYVFPEFETVNSLLVYQHQKAYNHTYTDNRIHRNGWQFGINTTGRKAFGYLYNKSITTKDEALRHYMSLNKDVPIVEDDVKSLSWRFYSAKRGVTNRVMKMGNKLYFYEPIQGIPLHHYAIFTNICIDYMMAKHINFNWNYRELLGSYLIQSQSYTPEQAVNEFHSVTMDRYFEIVCTNYIGRTMDSKFWRQTKRNCLERLLKSEDFMTFARKVVAFYDGKELEYPNFCIHKNVIISQYMKGLGVDFREIVQTDPQSLLNKYS
jgi:hypothetical protein